MKNSRLRKFKNLNFTICNLQSSIVNQKGSALIITLLLLAILTTLTVEFAYEVYIDTAMLSNWTNSQRASLIAKSAQNFISNYLKGINRFSYTFVGEVSLPVEKDLGPNTILSIRLEDENAKFNINTIIEPNGTDNNDALKSLKKLFEYLNIDSNIALAIADYIDPDHEPRLRDSEDIAKNTNLWSIDELKFIPGIDEKIFETIKPYITVYSNGLININTAKLPVLVSLKDMTEELANRIINYRETLPFEATNQVVKVSGMETVGQVLMGKITVKSIDFHVTTTATVNEITRIIENVVDISGNVKFWREG